MLFIVVNLPVKNLFVGYKAFFERQYLNRAETSKCSMDFRKAEQNNTSLLCFVGVMARVERPPF